MRALMNLAIEPALKFFEVSALVVIDLSQRAVKRVLKVLADTPLALCKSCATATLVRVATRCCPATICLFARPDLACLSSLLKSAPST